MTIDHRQVLRSLAALRVVIGAVLILMPRAAGRRFIGPVAEDRAAMMIVRGFGVRDLALGLGTLRALDRDESVAEWARLSALCDAGDAAAAVLGVGGIGPTRALTAVVSATGAAALGVSAADAVR